MATRAPSRTLTILTAALPELCAHLSETASSIAEAHYAAADIGWYLDWSLVLDGPVTEPSLAETLARWSRLGRTDADVPVRVEVLERHVGVAIGRSLSLALSGGEWVYPLDGDDLIDPDGLVALLQDRHLDAVGWASSNREIVGGGRNVYWSDESRWWERGVLEASWTAPFPFHPNSVLARRDLALAVGAWPAVVSNEGMGWCLAMSSLADGISTTHTVTRYRIWDQQTIAQPFYLHSRDLAYLMVAEIVNARRRLRGVTPIVTPTPGEIASREIIDEPHPSTENPPTPTTLPRSSRARTTHKVLSVAAGEAQFSTLDPEEERETAHALIDAQIAERSAGQRFGPAARAAGHTTVSLDDDANLVEITAEGTTRRL